MKHPPGAVAALVVAAVVWATPARAEVRILVDAGAPFTERDLSEAVELRALADGGDEEVVVRVARLGMDQLIVNVGARTAVVVLTDRDRAASTRVVALIVTSMLAGEPREDAPPPIVVEAPAAPPAGASRLTLQASTSLGRDDNGYWIPLLHAGGAYTVAPSARLVASAGLGKYDGYLDTHSVLVPLRFGIEGRSGAVGLELGAQILAFRESSCGAAQWGSAASVYGAGKVYLPINAGVRLVGELGGHFVMATSYTACRSATNYTGYGGWFGAGVEWSR